MTYYESIVDFQRGTFPHTWLIIAAGGDVENYNIIELWYYGHDGSHLTGDTFIWYAL